jgi:hypothetical protein
MAQISGPARSEINLAGIGLRIGDELGDGCGRERRIDHQDEGIRVDARDRSDVARDGRGTLFIEGHIDGVRGSDEQERIAVGWRTRDGLQRHIAAAARAIVDHHRLTESLR